MIRHAMAPPEMGDREVSGRIGPAYHSHGARR